MKPVTTLEGIFSALPTPFTENGVVDIPTLLDLMAWQLNPHFLHQSFTNCQPSVSGFVLYGTTGEAPTLSLQEKELLTKTTRERFPEQTLIVGIGSNNTAQTAEFAKRACSWGADAGLLVTPYYNRPNQDGLFQHTLKVAESVPNWPLVLYVVPSRTGVTLEIETVDRILSACPQVIAIKDASADLSYTQELISCCGNRASVLSGDDLTALPAWSIGAKGSISVISNLCPAEVMLLWSYHQGQAFKDAQTLFKQIHPMIKSLFIDTNPIPLKAALHQIYQMGLLSLSSPFNSHVRLPLTRLHEDRLAIVQQELKDFLSQYHV